MKTNEQPKDKIYLDSAENSQFQAVVESLGEGITFSDAEGKFLVYNLRMQEITGFTVDEANNSGDFTRLLYPDSLERQKALQRLKEITEHKVALPLEVETTIHAKDGTEKALWVSTRAIRFKDRDMFLSIYRDITQYKLQEEEFKKAKDKLEIQAWGLERANVGIKVLYKELEEKASEISKLAQVKSAFTSMVSHELRTPLGPIEEGVSIILDGLAGEINERQRDILETTRRNTERLHRLINNILDFQKLEADRMEFDFKEGDINEVVNEVYKSMGLVTKQKCLDFVLELEKDMPKIRFDWDKIIQVLTNLVNNAVKFTEKGNIKIKTAKRENIVQVTVSDTGPGIKEQDMPKLFQSFQRIETSQEKRIGGSGLGLAISKEIIIRHNGKIWAESEFGKGSAFHFVLPIKERRT